MTPILGRYGPFFLTSFFVILGLGVLAALAVTVAIARHWRLSGWVDGVLVAGGVAILIGRMSFVWLNQDYFRENVGQAWAVWQGGINPYAALIAGLLSYSVWLLFTHRPRGVYLDLIAPGLAIMVAMSWAACWFEGCAYGRETIPGLWAADLPDDFGVFAVRYQTQMAGFLIAALIASISAWWSIQRSPDAEYTGMSLCLTLAALSASWVLIAPFRGDPALIVFGQRADLLVAVIILVFSLGTAGFLAAHRTFAHAR